MKLLPYILTLLFMLTPAIALADEIPHYVQEKASGSMISQVNVTTAKIKSIVKDGNKITIEFDGYAEIGSQKTETMKQEEIFFQPRKAGEVRLIDLPEDSKEIKIYWGYRVTGSTVVLGWKKIR